MIVNIRTCSAQSMNSQKGSNQQPVFARRSPGMATPAGTVAFSDVSMGWRTPLDISGFTWTEPEQLGGRQLASIEHIRSSASLLDMVRGEHNFGPCVSVSSSLRVLVSCTYYLPVSDFSAMSHSRGLNVLDLLLQQLLTL